MTGPTDSVAQADRPTASDRPLFIPLRAKWYEAFERGERYTEWRAYGPRWNAHTCRKGRLAVLSYGYGRARRMTMKVVRFERVERGKAPPEAREIYPDAQYFAAISLR